MSPRTVYPAGSVAVIGIPGDDFHAEMRRTLLHCTESGYLVDSIAVGERAWQSARALAEAGMVDLIVTTLGSGHGWEDQVEVAGSGRTVMRAVDPAA